MDTDATKAPRSDAAWKEVLQDAMDEIVNMAKENYELKERVKRLEDIINRASLAFFSDASHRKVSIAMHTILEEFTRETKS
jgi:phosphoenolpyruvate-protein kinase (PTS system EI component)